MSGKSRGTLRGDLLRAVRLHRKALFTLASKRMSKPATPPDELLEYRKFLVAAEQKSQEDFDRTVLSLSGGALGISFVFLKDVIGPSPIAYPAFLFIAWVVWGISALAVLLSYFLSHMALRHAIEQVDAGTIRNEVPGGKFAKWTERLNAAGAVLFFVGVCSITLFAYANLSTKGAPNGRKETSTSTSTSKATATATSAVTASSVNPSERDTDNRGLHSTATAASSAASK